MAKTICLVASSLALGSGDGPNARQLLATSLADLGCHVHMVVPGPETRDRVIGGLLVHEVALPLQSLRFSPTHPWLDRFLTTGQVLCERVTGLSREIEIDVVDVPMSMGLALALLEGYRGPVVVWLPPPETRCRGLPPEWASVLAGLEDRALAKAAGAVMESRVAPDSQVGAQSVPSWLVRSDEPVCGQIAAFYQQVCDAWKPEKPVERAGRVFQVVEALDYGDGVGNIALRNSALLRKLGHPYPILSLFSDPRVASQTEPIEGFSFRPDDAIIFHYASYSHLEEFICAFPGPKAVHFHNITPPKFFEKGSTYYRMTEQGYRQLERMAAIFDLAIGVSQFNLDVYAGLLSRRTPSVCLPPVIDQEEILRQTFNTQLVQRLLGRRETNFLFVGRVSPNKRQHEVMRVFDIYHQFIDPHSRLFLVGDSDRAPRYVHQLASLRLRLPSRDSIHFVGRVTDEDLRAYYRAADVFVCASEHEGFGVPVVEAMAHHIPVVARSAAAVPETMGRGGILVDRWEPAAVAELIHTLLHDQPFRSRVLAAQEDNLQRFTEEHATTCLSVAVDYLCRRKTHPDLVWRGPGI